MCLCVCVCVCERERERETVTDSSERISYSSLYTRSASGEVSAVFVCSVVNCPTAEREGSGGCVCVGGGGS